MRKDKERQTAGGGFVYIPVVSFPLIFSGDAKPILRSFLRLDRYRYDMSPPGPQPIPILRKHAQTIIDNEIIPAALGLTDLAPSASSIGSIEILVNDELETGIGIPLIEATENKTITLDYGLNNTLTAIAWLHLQFDAFIETVDKGSIEETSQSWERYVNTQVILIASEYSHASGKDRFFDQGVISALYPSKAPSMGDIAAFGRHVNNLWRLVLGHEACHHIMGHASSNSLTRGEKELEADRCSLRILLSIVRKTNSELTADMRHSLMRESAWDLALTSLMLWPVAPAEDYPSPRARYDALIAANPSSDFPGLSDDYEKQIQTIGNPLPGAEAFSAREKIGSLEFGSLEDPKLPDATLDMLYDVEESPVRYCRDRDCFVALQRPDVKERFGAIRALLYLASSRVEIASRDGPYRPSLIGTRVMAVRALQACDMTMPQTRTALIEVIRRVDAALLLSESKK